MNKRPYKNPQVNLRLPQELKDRLTALSEEKGRSTNAEMVDAIAYWVDREERLQKELKDRRAWDERFYDLEEEIEYLKAMVAENANKKPT